MPRASSAPKAAWCWSRATCCKRSTPPQADDASPPRLRRTVPAAQDRRAGRRRRRAAAGAARCRAAMCGVLLPGFPAILAGVAERRRRWPTLTAPLGRAPAAAAARPRSRPPAHADIADLCARRARALRPARQSLRRTAASPTATTTAASRCSAGPRPAGRRGSTRDWQPEIVHAHDWHAGLAPAYLAVRAAPGAPARRQRLHDPQPGLPGPVPALRSSPNWACPPTASPSTASSSTARCRS